ncbi:MAG TPA: TraB/GumN family protein [Candidatus Poseidoniales archaeon]|mgnify:FL=1|jgi:pheromone shutdown-related protein TraB|nr:MAG: TraB family protein [Euryarchaeota archaeon]HIG33446.1 TraB/GumN family protein [Candidatus Poseidoniales archaeon]HIL67266.1 TraB/GumN family protein [Candidatus Poseidoniales archaeon]
MSGESNNIIEIDENLRLLGTAHVSSESVELVRNQIEEWGPDLVAVELCPSRMAALTKPDSLDSEDLLKIIKEGRSAMILLQSALAAQQRRMGVSSGEKPGAELLAAVNAAEDSGVPVEMIDRDVGVTLRRAWKKMGIIEKWRILNALLWGEDDGEVSIDKMLGDSDLLSSMMEEAREIAPGAGEVLIDERDSFLAGRIQQIRGEGKVLAVIGAGHLSGVVHNLGEPAMETTSRLAELSKEPPKSIWPRLLMAAIPIFLFGAVAWMVVNGEMVALKQTAQTWLLLNAILAGVGVLIARGHPLSILVGAIASPITSLNPTLAAGWFAGYTQLKVASPTGKDAQDFLVLDEVSLFWKNRVGRVLMVTALGNLGSMAGAWLAGGAILGMLLG